MQRRVALGRSNSSRHSLHIMNTYRANGSRCVPPVAARLLHVARCNAQNQAAAAKDANGATSAGLPPATEFERSADKGEWDTKTPMSFIEKAKLYGANAVSV